MERIDELNWQTLPICKKNCSVGKNSYLIYFSPILILSQKQSPDIAYRGYTFRKYFIISKKSVGKVSFVMPSKYVLNLNIFPVKLGHSNIMQRSKLNISEVI